MNRVFEDKTAVRERVPLLIGLTGASGSGKTFSSLRLATGIQKVSGGDIFVVDSEARRSLNYSDQFKFRHLEFNAPFNSLDYLAAIEHCYNKGAGVIIVDSMSHEHEGPGGLLETHEAEVQRLSGGDPAKAERVKILAWSKPKQQRRRLINTILQMNANFIFCFRSKEKIKMISGGKIEELGFQAIAGEEFLYEMTVNILLPPNSGGIPSWNPEHRAEQMMVKLPIQFKQLFADKKPLDEATGESLAKWAAGSVNPSKDKQAQSPAAASPSCDAQTSPLDYFIHCKDQLANAGNIDELKVLWSFATKHKDKMTGKQFTEIEALKNQRKQELMVTA